MVVTVPHTWNVMPDHYSYDGIGWYRRRFMLPAIASHGHLRLRFEAVFYVARVWLNGIYLGEHEGGYTPFEFDVNGLAKPGVENILAVQVDNLRATNRLPADVEPDGSFDWWNYGGIVRNISIHTPAVHSLPSSRLSPRRILSRWTRLIRRQSPLW
jgi:beta-glucuronidase